MRRLSILLFGAAFIVLAAPTAAQATLVNTTHSNIRHPGKAAPAQVVINTTHSNIRHPGNVATPAQAVINISHSNIRHPATVVTLPTGTDANHGVWKAPAGVDCVKAGGIVTTDAHGKAVCTKRVPGGH